MLLRQSGSERLLICAGLPDLAPDLPRPDRFRVTAVLNFLTTDRGGRKTPVASDYRTPCWFGLRAEDGEAIYNDVFWYFRAGHDATTRDGTLWVPPGGSCIADGLVAYPAYLRPVVRVGSTFDVWEGRTVATGAVEEVFDPGLETD